jgi:type 1 glutamine amidotransferase
MMLADVLILAGDSYHDPQVAFDAFAPILAAQGLTTECITEPALLCSTRLSGKRLFILQRDGMISPDRPEAPWMTLEQEQAIEQFVLAGGGFLALHNAAWGYPWQGPYRHVLGGYYLTHPPLARFRVQVVGYTHPVARGIQAFEIEDEQHFLWFDYDRVTLLLTNHGQDGRQSAAGWAYQLGKGRVVFLANGHTAEAHAHPQFVRLKENAVRWLSRREETSIARMEEVEP